MLLVVGDQHAASQSEVGYLREFSAYVTNLEQKKRVWREQQLGDLGPIELFGSYARKFHLHHIRSRQGNPPAPTCPRLNLATSTQSSQALFLNRLSAVLDA